MTVRIPIREGLLKKREKLVLQLAQVEQQLKDLEAIAGGDN